MDSIDKKQFADQFALTCLAYEKSFNKELASLYFSDLSEYGISEVVGAFTRHRKDPDRGRFFPKVADLIYQITSTEKQNDDRLAQEIELEWSKSLRAASNGRSPANASVYCKSALELIGGVSKVGYTLEKDIPFLRAEFAAKYKALVKASAGQIDASIPHHLELIKTKTQVAVK